MRPRLIHDGIAIHVAAGVTNGRWWEAALHFVGEWLNPALPTWRELPGAVILLCQSRWQTALDVIVTSVVACRPLTQCKRPSAEHYLGVRPKSDFAFTEDNEPRAAAGVIDLVHDGPPNRRNPADRLTLSFGHLRMEAQ